MNKKQKLAWVLTVLLSALYIIVGNRVANRNYIMRDDLSNGVPEKMKVVNIVDAEYELALYGENAKAHGEDIILFEGEFLEGYKKGTTALAVQRVDELYAVEMRPVEVGSTIVVYANPDPAIDVKYMFAEFHRVTILWVLIGVFCLLLLLFGRWQGVNTLISLMFTIGAVFLVFIPGNLHLCIHHSYDAAHCVRLHKEKPDRHHRLCRRHRHKRYTCYFLRQIFAYDRPCERGLDVSDDAQHRKPC